MNKHIELYKERSKAYNDTSKKLLVRMTYIGFLRLLVFVSTAFGAYQIYGNSLLFSGILVIGIVVFLWLVSYHSDLKKNHAKYRELEKINLQELDFLKGNFKGFPTGEKYNLKNHEFAQDIDLFGSGSFFQYLNRTALHEGEEKLARTLASNETNDIHQKQETVRELSDMLDWRQEYTALGRLIKTETNSADILKWVRTYKSFVPEAFNYIPSIFSSISILLILAYAIGLIPGISLGAWFFFGLLISGFFLKKVNQLSSHTSKVQETFAQYYHLLELIEKASFSSKILRNRQNDLEGHLTRASVAIRKFSKAIDSLDQRNNMIFGILGNGFMLWDIRQSKRLENWVELHREQVDSWFEVIHFFDSQNSLGNFSFNHPSYSFPILSPQPEIEAEAFSHPLLDPSRRVDNNFRIKEGEFFIITGANMAGKSTFLRSVGILIAMANCGLPVCAAKCRYHPIRLITSMRTTDSLNDDESYFFSELKRLKFIVERIREQKYLIILDEILKGTNSEDKARGSKKFIEKLVKSGSTGIVATHDLSLCQISKEHMQVKNFYFEAEVINDELHFDYELKTGICKNMNASFLLKKMKIVD